MIKMQKEKKKKNKKHPKEERDHWFIDLLVSIPELIIYPIRLLFRGVTSLIKHWN